MNKIEKGPAFWKAFGQAAALWAVVAVAGSLLLPGGSIDKKEWLKGFEKPEKLPLPLNKYGQKVYNAAIAAQMDAGNDSSSLSTVRNSSISRIPS